METFWSAGWPYEDSISGVYGLTWAPLRAGSVDGTVLRTVTTNLTIVVAASVPLYPVSLCESRTHAERTSVTYIRLNADFPVSEGF